MTAQRQETALLRPGIALIGRLIRPCLLACICVICCGLLAEAATTERIVVNRFSGVAIEGFDPVAYFVDGNPAQGSAEFEASLWGAVWRFRNEGNRASFLAHPEVYGPQFGGYDPADIARGVTVAGNPRFFVITAQRLYLFSREVNRDAFAADPERFLSEVNKRWPALQERLGQ
jgi:YHS domain-containing protein